jgi:predicted DNA-binding transcriptional regulator YafY
LKQRDKDMPTNKNAQLRYQVLDRCFSDFTHKYSIDDLIDKVNDVLYDLNGTEVSIRQIRDDIKYMRDRVTYNAPIKAYPWDGKKCYYRYEDRDFSIFNNDLSVEEVNKLRLTLDMLNNYRGIPGNSWLEEVISNLEYRFGIKSNKDNVIAFEQNEQLKGLKYLSEVIDATVNHTPLIIYYRTYKGKELTSTLHPYHVKQYNNRWFLFGYEDESGKIANKALDRIQRISLANVPFKSNNYIDFSHFLMIL